MKIIVLSKNIEIREDTKGTTLHIMQHHRERFLYVNRADMKAKK